MSTLTPELTAHFDTVMAALPTENTGARRSLRELWFELASVDVRLMMMHRNGYTEVLDALGAPDKGEAPALRLIKLQRLLAIDMGLE